MKEGKFSTPTGKIEVYSEALEKVGFDPLPTYLGLRRMSLRTPELLEKHPLILSTGNRNLYYTHGQLRRIKSSKEKNPEQKAEIRLKTSLGYGIKDANDIIKETNTQVVRIRVHVDESVREGIIFVTHGWPRESEGNLLTDTDCREPVMSYPDMESILCAVRNAQK